jgi:Lon-like ATP-dependent protease
VISALSGIPVRQDVAMTGSLDVRGRVLPVGGVTGKIEAAIDTGIKKALIPTANAEDVYLSKEKRDKIEIIKVNDIYGVLEHALAEGNKKKELLRKIKAQSG